MASISIRLPSSVVERVNLLRAERSWPLGRLIEKATERGEENPLELTRYLESYTTHRGRLRRRGRKVVNSSIADAAHARLVALGAPHYTKSEVAGACIRLLLDTCKLDHACFQKKTFMEMAFDVERIEMPVFSKGPSLDSIPAKSRVLVEAQVILYAFVAARCQAIKGWRSASEIGTSRECLNLMRRSHRGEILGFTTPGQMSRLARKLCGLTSFRWASDEAKAADLDPPAPHDDRIVTLSPQRHAARVNEFIANVTSTNLQVVADTPSALNSAILSIGPEGDWDAQMLMSAVKELGVDDVVMAVASPEYTKFEKCADLQPCAVHTPHDVRSASAIEDGN